MLWKRALDPAHRARCNSLKIIAITYKTRCWAAARGSIWNWRGRHTRNLLPCRAWIIGVEASTAWQRCIERGSLPNLDGLRGLRVCLKFESRTKTKGGKGHSVLQNARHLHLESPRLRLLVCEVIS